MISIFRGNSALILVCSVFIAAFSYADDYYSPELLNLGVNGKSQLTNEDISIFSENELLPGEYNATLFLNKNKIDNRTLELVLSKNKDNKNILIPCFSLQELNDYGINLDSNEVRLIKNNQCVNLNYIPYLKLNIDIDTNNIYITLPQSFIDDKKIYRLQEKYWDNGIPVAILNYSFSGNNNRNNDINTDSYYANIRSGFNFGAWRYRNYSIWNKSNNKSGEWDSISNTLYRNINAINSELILGNTYSSSRIFDSVKIKGVTLQSDNSMLPNFMQSYAPNVSGIANSESVITITQNDNVIYKNSVPAGPFDITDYYPMSNGGNLFVNVKEAGGFEKNFIIPYSSIASLERKGQLKYSLSTGKYDSNNNQDEKYYNQLELYYGLNNYITIYGGSQLSTDYHSFSLGSGLNMGSAGAITIDVIQSNAKINFEEDHKTYTGKSFKINYTKNIVPTNTNLSIIGYRHFDKNYFSFNDAMFTNSQGLNSIDNHYKLKNEYSLSLSQILPHDFGSINIASTFYNYSNRKNISSYNIGYYNTFNKINYSLYYTSFNGDNFSDTGKGTSSLNFNISIPFSLYDNAIWSSYGLTTDSDHQTSHTVRLNGLAGERNQYNWGVYQGYGNKGMNYNGGLSGSYKSQYANLSSGYSYSSNSKNLNYNVSGSLLASDKGIVLSQPLQETNALIKVDGADGVSILNSQSSVTNSQGLTIYSGLSPYRSNSILLDMSSIPENIDVENNILSNIVPTKGAVILADFKSHSGYKLLINLQTNKVKEIPIGAKATLSNKANYLVGNFNRLYVVADNESDVITVNWIINDTVESCDINYDVRNINSVNGIYIFDAKCL